MIEAPDWDRLFAQVTLETGLDYSVTVNWTPRQLSSVCLESHRRAKESKGESVPDELPPSDPHDGEPYRTWKKRLGLDKHECWRDEFDQPDDPLLADREIIRQRHESQIYECGSRGLFEAGIDVWKDGRKTVLRINRKDRAAMRDFFEQVWQSDCEKFELLKAARATGESNGTENGQA